jgi:hypothetical protein
MSQRVIVSSYVIIKDDCPIRFNILDSSQVEIVCDQPRDGFEFIMTAETLRTFIQSGAVALADMDALAAAEDAVGEPERPG